MGQENMKKTGIDLANQISSHVNQQNEHDSAPVKPRGNDHTNLIRFRDRQGANQPTRCFNHDDQQ